MREVIARIGAHAAVKDMQRTLQVRPTASRDDRRLWSRAAREALLTEAKRRSSGDAQAAA